MGNTTPADVAWQEGYDAAHTEVIDKVLDLSINTANLDLTGFMLLSAHFAAAANLPNPYRKGN